MLMMDKTDIKIERIRNKTFIEQLVICRIPFTSIATTVVLGMFDVAAYLQAKDETDYNKWKSIEKQEAVNAGLGDIIENK